jgi:flagellar biosynthetic protein FliR
MNSAITDTVGDLMAYLPAFIRISATLLLMPGLGEVTIPAIIRVGLSLGMTLALSPVLPAFDGLVGASFSTIASTVISELLTGIWFGWLTRLVASALPMAGQYAGYMIGLSNILQNDVNAGAQSDAMGTLFSMAMPVMFLTSGLYMLPLRALVGFFDLVPIGHVLPVADGTRACVAGVETLCLLSLQLASPFIVASILWNILIGQLARLGGRMQIYFLSFPGQILAGLLILMLSIQPILIAWQHYAESILWHLPGS